MEIDVINISGERGRRQDVVYIGRGSPLGNPWTHEKSKLAEFKVGTREESILKYEEWIEERLKYANAQSTAMLGCVRRFISEGKLILACFCKPLPCHGDVLARIILQKAEEQRKYVETTL